MFNSIIVITEKKWHKYMKINAMYTIVTIEKLGFYFQVTIFTCNVREINKYVNFIFLRRKIYHQLKCLYQIYQK